MTTSMSVTSHVGRDIVAAAGSFKSETAVVWEYVANSLQYVDPGITPIINVRILPLEKTIVIVDNGRGMTEESLRHFFTMHGENRERKQGRMGRGKFGTGKSAAFGIANTLEIETVCSHVYNKVRLKRETIDQSDGKAIPLEWLEKNVPIDSSNGTTIIIKDVLLSRVDNTSIIEYVERHFGDFRGQNPQVAINNHVCEYHEPAIDFIREFLPSDAQAASIGFVKLIVKVSLSPLAESEQGIVVMSGPGSRVGIEKSGIERKEMGNHLFGEIEVPKLEEPSDIQPYDATRNFQLNTNHPVVRELMKFIGPKLEEVRQELASRERNRRKTEEYRKLEVESKSIAELLNKDFQEMQKRLSHIQAYASGKGPIKATFGNTSVRGEDGTDAVPGTQKLGNLPENDRIKKQGEGIEKKGRPIPNINRTGQQDDNGQFPVDPAGGMNTKKKTSNGGFTVDYRRLGADEKRSVYDSNTMTIVINLDHPLVVTALQNRRVDDAVFKRLSHEIAFTEYAFVIGQELAREDPEMVADDLLFDLRGIINRLSCVSAELYKE